MSIISAGFYALKTRIWDPFFSTSAISSVDTSSSPIQRLPSELLLLIFSFLSFESLKQTSLVCKDWRLYTLDTFKHSRRFPQDANETVIRRISAFCQKQHTLRSARLPVKSTPEFLDLVKQILYRDGHAPYLTRVCLKNYHFACINILLLQDISKCTALRKWTIHGISIASMDSSSIALDLPHLRILRLKFSILTYPIQWHTPLLTEICCLQTMLPEAQLSDLLTQSSATLQRLSLKDTSFPFSKAMISALQGTTALTDLRLERFRFLTDPNDYSNEVPPVNPMAPEDYAHYFSTLSNLSSLSFHPPPELFTSQVIRAIAQNGESLITLELHTDRKSPIVFNINDLLENNRLQQLRRLFLEYARKRGGKDKDESGQMEKVIIEQGKVTSFLPSPLEVALQMSSEEQPPAPPGAWRLGISFPKASIHYAVYLK